MWRLAEDTLSQDEINDLADWLRKGERLTQGERVKAFERAWSEWLGCADSVFVGSGTTANFALMACAAEKVEREVPRVGVAAVIERGPHNETLNVACRQVRSIKEMAETIAREAGYEGEVRFSGTGPDGQYRKDADPSRLAAAVPAWTEIETPFEEGVRRTLAWYRDHVATR